MLTRLRQLVLHPGLIPANYLEQLRQSIDTDSSQPTTIAPEDRMRLQRVLAQRIEDSEECPICFSMLSVEPRITACAHCYCLAWCVCSSSWLADVN
jgi:SWI/SNF-related matrix-associated actin-dependent regulator of chromatin subfamily A3